MPKIIYVDINGARRECNVANGVSVMEGAIANGIAGILAICGGSCACSTCHTYIDPEWMDRVGAASDIEDSTLELAYDRKPNSRLSCQIEVTDKLDGLVVHVAQNDG
ncbi:MAG: 2Fe-2S iron-sulfur cluster binding domain-containing protein [Gammaproteobacteria bacterium]|nr:2Fe-2S iron-sulfur cluster binding domain-containing protein [Gammaproteobacteria bacterium]